MYNNVAGYRLGRKGGIAGGFDASVIVISFLCLFVRLNNQAVFLHKKSLPIDKHNHTLSARHKCKKELVITFAVLRLCGYSELPIPLESMPMKGENIEEGNKWIHKEIENALHRGIRVTIGGKSYAGQEGEFSVVAEDGCYMTDYISDESGKIVQINFEQIE